MSSAWRNRAGFNLLEMMITLVIMGILATVALPGLGKAKERSYWQQAEQTLLAIYAGERAYFLLNDTYHGPLGPGDSMTAWRVINVDNPNLASIPVTYTVSAAGNSFTATAARDSGPCGGSLRTINETRTFVPASGSCWCGAC